MSFKVKAKLPAVQWVKGWMGEDAEATDTPINESANVDMRAVIKPGVLMRLQPIGWCVLDPGGSLRAARSVFGERELQQHPCQLSYTPMQQAGVQPVARRSSCEHGSPASDNTGCPWTIWTATHHKSHYKEKLHSPVLRLAARAATKKKNKKNNCDKEHSQRRKHWCQSGLRWKYFHSNHSCHVWLLKFRVFPRAQRDEGANLSCEAPEGINKSYHEAFRRFSLAAEPLQPFCSNWPEQQLETVESVVTGGGGRSFTLPRDLQ